MRTIIALLLLILALVGGALFYLYSSLDSIVASMIEEHGRRATGTPVTVESVEISLSEGRATIRNLRVANPPGFESSEAFMLGHVSVVLDLGSLSGELVAMSEVVVEDPVVNYEMNAEKTSNLEEIYAHLKKDGGGAGKDSEAPRQEPPDLRIESFTFERGIINADATRAGGPARSVELASLQLRDVGGPDGAPPAEVGRAIAEVLIRESGRSLARSGLEDYIDRQLGGEAGEAVKEILRGIMN